jgi:hypothetical protein
MKDENTIPEVLYAELVEIFGEKRANEIIIECNYNYSFIARTIMFEEMKRGVLGIPLKRWIVFVYHLLSLRSWIIILITLILSIILWQR